MENNMHLWEIHSSCSFFHIQEESFRSKLAKPQVQDIHIQEEASNVKWKKPQVCMRDSLFLHLSHTGQKKQQIWNGKPQVQDIHIQRRSFKSDMENCTYERFTLLVAFHIPEGRSNRSEMAKPQVWDIQYSHIQEKDAFESDMDNHKYEERFSSSCSFSHTGGSSKYDMEKTASIRRDSLFLAVFHIQQKALNLKWKTTSRRGFT